MSDVYEQIFDRWLSIRRNWSTIKESADDIDKHYKEIFELCLLYKKVDKTQHMEDVYCEYIDRLLNARGIGSEATHGNYSNGADIHTVIRNNEKCKLLKDLACYYISHACDLLFDEAVSIINQLLPIWNDKISCYDTLAYFYRLKGKNKECDEYVENIKDLVKEMQNRVEIIHELLMKGEIEEHSVDNALAFIKNEQARIDNYNHTINVNLSINCFYVDKREEGIKACNNILIERGVYWNAFAAACTNIRYYIETIGRNQKHYDLKDIIPADIDDGLYTLGNVGIFKNSKGVMRLLARYVTYSINEQGQYEYHNGCNYIGTRNFLGDFDPKDGGAVTNYRELKEITSQVRPFIRGLEDCRMIEYNDELYVSATSYEHHSKEMPQIMLSTLNKEDGYQLIDTTHMDYKSHECQKNWTPFEYKGKMCFLYSIDPVCVLEYNCDAKSLTPIINKQHKKVKNNHLFLRGSTPPIRWSMQHNDEGTTDGYIIASHEVVFKSNNTRIYFHRFIFFDSDMNIVKMSYPFSFWDVGIEFTLGMAHDDETNSVVIPVSINDRDTKLFFIPDERINQLLNHEHYYN